MQMLLLNVKQVAQVLQLSRSYVYRLIRQGELQTIKFGTAVRILPEDLDAYIRKKGAHGYLEDPVGLRQPDS